MLEGGGELTALKMLEPTVGSFVSTSVGCTK